MEKGGHEHVPELIGVDCGKIFAGEIKFKGPLEVQQVVYQFIAGKFGYLMYRDFCHFTHLLYLLVSSFVYGILLIITLIIG